MSEVVTSLRHAAPLQAFPSSVLAEPVPDLRSLNLKVESLQRQVELQHDSLMKIFDAFRLEISSDITSLRSGGKPEDFRPFLRCVAEERHGALEA